MSLRCPVSSFTSQRLPLCGPFEAAQRKLRCWTHTRSPHFRCLSPLIAHSLRRRRLRCPCAETRPCPVSLSPLKCLHEKYSELDSYLLLLQPRRSCRPHSFLPLHSFLSCSPTMPTPAGAWTPRLCSLLEWTPLSPLMASHQ